MIEERVQKLIQKNMKQYSKYIDIEIIEQIIDLNNPIVIKKGSTIVSEGKAFFLLSGIIRGFYLDIDGKDTTNHFIFENHTYGSDFLTIDKPHVCSYEAVDDCVALPINMNVFKEFIKTNNQLLLVYINILETNVKNFNIKEIDLLTKTAKERYLKLIDLYPDIEEKINQAHIASYLGISPISLNRIRSSIS